MKKISHSKTSLSELEKRNALSVLKSGLLTSGNVAKKFSKQLGDYIQQDNVLLYSSGSSALFNILHALNLNASDEVLIPNYICENVLQSVVVAGAKPVLYDNAATNWVSGNEEISKRVTRRTKAIIINHTFGIYNEAIKNIKSKGIFIIEDCCHLLTSPSTDFPILKYSDAGFFSFNATKLLATGEGGAVATKNKGFFNELEKIKIDESMSDLSASIGVSQLNRYANFLKKRKEIANEYDVFFDRYAIEKNVKSSIYFRYTIKVPHSTQKKFLASPKVAFKKGVDDLLIYKLKGQKNSLINSYNDFLTTVSVPIYPLLKRSEIKVILEEAKRILNA